MGALVVSLCLARLCSERRLAWPWGDLFSCDLLEFSADVTRGHSENRCPHPGDAGWRDAVLLGVLRPDGLAHLPPVRQDAITCSLKTLGAGLQFPHLA